MLSLSSIAGFSTTMVNNATKWFKNPLMIKVALTGNVPNKKMNPNVPMTPEEVAADVKKCYAAGATMFHVHARDNKEQPTLDLGYYRAIVREIRKECPEAILQLSTGARAGTDARMRCNIVRMCPEMGSFTTGSNNLAGIVYENSPQFMFQLAKVFKDCDVAPEIECFDTGHIQGGLYLAKLGLLKLPLHFGFVLGTAGAAPGDVKTMVHMADYVPKGSTWCAIGIGRHQTKLCSAATAMGGHVRVGLEDNVYDINGNPDSNLKQVEKMYKIAKEMGRPIANVEQVREMLSLDPKNEGRLDNYINDGDKLHPVDTSMYGLDFKE